MKIQVTANTPKPIELCAKSSYISHSEKKVTEIFDEDFGRDPLKYLSKIVSMGHLSVLEHATFNILVEDAPVITEIFAIRFRLASFTVKSRRYTNVMKDGFYQDGNLALDEKFLGKITAFYGKMLEHEIPLEDARFILPYNFKTNFIMSVNARELGYMLYSALYETPVHAIQEMARNIISELSEIFPLLKTHLELFGKEKESAAELNLDQEVFLPQKEVSLIAAPENPDGLYSQLLAFGKNGNFYTGRLSKTELSQSLRIAHNRALESLNFTFFLRDISLAGLTHLLRHRIQSPILPDLFSSNLNYNVLIPPSVKNAGLGDEFLALALESREKEKESENFYYRLVAALFPVMTTINARELIHILRLRLCMRAQWEVRELADLMLNELKKAAPSIFKNVGPGCVMDDVCPEGSHTCGKMAEVRRKYGK